jgi:fumarylacetoacetate (FAA) hydrolase
MPPSFWTDPLVYQGGSDDLLGPMDDVPVASEDSASTSRREVAVITDDVPMEPTRCGAGAHQAVDAGQRLVAAQPDSGRTCQGFGFYQSKPATAFSPCAVTPDEARRRVARRQGSPAARVAHQRQLFGSPMPATT